jgi:hypothetical protein
MRLSGANDGGPGTNAVLGPFSSPPQRSACAIASAGEVPAYTTRITAG